MEDFCSYVGQAIDLFRYDPRSPMLFSSGLFLFVFLGFSLIYGLLKRRLTLRIVYVTLFSLYFYYKTSGLFFLLLVGLSLSDFAIGRLMHRSRRSGARKSLLVLSLLINLGLLCYFKYADLIVSAVAGLIDRTLTLPDIFLPVGISFFTFQSMSYVIDLIPPADRARAAAGSTTCSTCRSFRSSWRVRSSGPGTFCRRFTGIPFSFRATCSDAESF